jgi:hypothetical protein
VAVVAALGDEVVGQGNEQIESRRQIGRDASQHHLVATPKNLDLAHIELEILGQTHRL